MHSPISKFTQVSRLLFFNRVRVLNKSHYFDLKEACDQDCFHLKTANANFPSLISVRVRVRAHTIRGIGNIIHKVSYRVDLSLIQSLPFQMLGNYAVNVYS